MTDDDLLTVAEVMAKLRIKSRTTLHALVTSGKLRAKHLSARMLRFRRCDVQKYLDDLDGPPVDVEGEDQQHGDIHETGRALDRRVRADRGPTAAKDPKTQPRADEKGGAGVRAAGARNRVWAPWPG